MSEPVVIEVLPKRPGDHPAAKAWSRLGLQPSEPGRIEIVKLRGRKTAVYRLDGVGPRGHPVIAKRCPSATAWLEWSIYREVLPRLSLPVLRCYGLVEESDGDFCWLFLDDAHGQEYVTGNREHRALAGRWLGALHKTAAEADLDGQLPSREPAYYLERLRAARETFRSHLSNPVLPDHDLRTLASVGDLCGVLETRWGELEDLCATTPRTLVHGDFATKNVRVQATNAGLALLAYDWEYAGWGVPAIDLAQFTELTVSPDLETYCQAVNGLFAPRDLRAINRLAECGRFFRIVDDVSWASSYLVFESYVFLQKPMTWLKTSEARLAAALQAARWT